MKNTIKTITANYAANKEGKTFDSTNQELVFNFVGKFKTFEAYSSRIGILCENDEQFKSILKDLRQYKGVEKLNRAAVVLAELCEAIVNPEPETKTVPIESSPVLTDLFENSVLIKSVGFKKAVHDAIGSNECIFEATRSNINDGPLKPFMKSLCDTIWFLGKRGITTIVAPYDNIDSTNLFVFFLDQAISVMNDTTGKHMRLVVLRGKESKINLGVNLDYCVTGDFLDYPSVIQKHGNQIRKITQFSKDFTKASIHKVYYGEVALHGTGKLPVAPYIKEMPYQEAGFNPNGFKKACRYAIPIVSANYAVNIDKRTISSSDKTTIQMIKDCGIKNALYIGNYSKSFKYELDSKTDVVAFKEFSWNKVLGISEEKQDMTLEMEEVSATAEYSDKDIVTDLIPPFAE